MYPGSSLIISTYNWPKALDCCFNSILGLKVWPDEIIIADDGSTEDTRELIAVFRKKSRVPVVHIWQPDTGFQLAKIRNKAVAAARYDYIIQIDGDLILDPYFVKDHLSSAKPGRFIGGSRCLLSKCFSEQLLEDPRVQVSLWKQGVRNRENGIRMLPVGKLLNRLVKTSSSRSIRGCNMSFWRADFIRVNGYNEDYIGWGKEDTDLVIRFFKIGLERPMFKFIGIAYHIWHKEADRSGLEKNEALLHQLNSGLRHSCENGVSKYL
ncbi:glycosyltransferase family 2 protein [Flavihumibacter sp. CACIAM 22H1]|uniref:glycosyltransferase family 2 protein n=1 Tax=Flavihumibacter sp. CACIAM 22H1 TaxID=1812911 RepID=UPI0007A8E193|nr:glycosyltransferase family 2 protein [Flavihumibacter sp. CACIAM 22H1]KYP14909.1 MAG: hypothetical protein A1D16_03295 [Flavihumibacter sp. CACIAM 22H1]